MQGVSSLSPRLLATNSRRSPLADVDDLVNGLEQKILVMRSQRESHGRRSRANSSTPPSTRSVHVSPRSVPKMIRTLSSVPVRMFSEENCAQIPASPASLASSGDLEMSSMREVLSKMTKQADYVLRTAAEALSPEQQVCLFLFCFMFPMLVIL